MMSRLSRTFSYPWDYSADDPSLGYTGYSLRQCDYGNNCSWACSNDPYGFADGIAHPAMFSSKDSLYNCILYPNISRNLQRGAYSDPDVQVLTGRGFHGNESSDLYLSSTIALNVEKCLVDYCSVAPSCTPGNTPCTSANLVLDNRTLSAQGFVDCYASLCTPSTVSADIAGVGAVIAYLSQIALGILAYSFLSMITLSRYVSRRRALRTEHRGVSADRLRAIRQRWRRHEQAMISALVEFHKAQCFFAISIQVAALAFLHGLDSISSGSRAFALLPVSTIGYGPVVFVLWILLKYEKGSLYLYILSQCSWVLSSVVYWKGHSDNDYATNEMHDIDIPSCGASSSPLVACTYSDARIRIVLKLAYSFWWLLCSCYFIYIALWQCSSSRNVYSHPGIVLEIGFLCFWASMFATTYYEWSYYIGQGYIDTSTWGFGQIVAITVWLPTLAEFLWLEMNGVVKGSEYRLAKPLKVVNGEDEGNSSPEAQDAYYDDRSGTALLDLPISPENAPAVSADESAINNQSASLPANATGLTAQDTPKADEPSKERSRKRRTTL